MAATYEDVLSAWDKIKSHVKDTSLDKSFSASRICGREIFLKMENEQFTGSFKVRGATNKILSLNAEERTAGVIASSAGNHAQGVALSASNLGISAQIVMPTTAPLIKVNATRDYGAEVISYGQIYDDAYAKAKDIAQTTGRVFIHPYEDEKVIAGQGTVALEIYKKMSDLDCFFIPLGGGGLISGMARVIKKMNPRARVIGVQAELSPSMSKRFAEKKHPGLTQNVNQAEPGRLTITTIADGIAIKKPSDYMLHEYLLPLVDEVVTVNEDEIAQAIFFLIERVKSISEGSGAVGLAACFKYPELLGQKNLAVISGGNIDLNLISKIIEKGLMNKNRLAEIHLIGGDTPGLLAELTQLIAKTGANILQVHHDRNHKGLGLRQARISFVLETNNEEQIQLIKKLMKDSKKVYVE